MPPQRRLKPFERQSRIGHIEGGQSITARRTLKRASLRDLEQSDLPRSGRPRKSFCLNDLRLHRRAERRPLEPYAGFLDTTLLAKSTLKERFPKIDPDFRKRGRHWKMYLTHEEASNRYMHAGKYREWRAEGEYLMDG